MNRKTPELIKGDIWSIFHENLPDNEELLLSTTQQERLENHIQSYADQEMALFYSYVEENYHSWKEGEIYLHTSLFHGDDTHYTTQQLITKYKEENGIK